MHPLEAVRESELITLSRAAGKLLDSHYRLAPGHRSSRRQPGAGSEFLDFRDFAAGDDRRYIDWRSTARSRHPQVRRYANEVSADWYVAVDCSISMSVDTGDKWARAIQCAAAVCYLLLQQDNRVSLLFFSDRVEHRVPLGRGYTHYAGILRILRHVDPRQSAGGTDLRSCQRHIRQHSPVFVISDFLTEDGMLASLNALSRRGDRLHALQILSDWDFRMPAQSRIRIRDVESGDSLTADTIGLDKEFVTASLNRFIGQLVLECRKSRIRFSHHRQDEHWKSILLDHLQITAR